MGLFFSVSEAAVSEAQKKQMSTFLSNFTELSLMEFNADEILNPENPADAIRFGIWHNYRNNYKSRIVPCKDKKCPHGPLTIDPKFVSESIEKYFGAKFKAHQTIDDAYFYDGKLYHFDGADGEATYFARVKEAELNGGVWTAAGELYNADDESDILGEFTAEFKPHKWGGKDTYYLISMRVPAK